MGARVVCIESVATALFEIGGRAGVLGLVRFLQASALGENQPPGAAEGDSFER